MSFRPFSVIALVAAAATVSACQTAESLNPFSGTTPYKAHCRAALNYLVARETDKRDISVEDTDQRPRDQWTAVTIVYVQGEARRLFTCLYDPNNPNDIRSISYRGRFLSPADLAAANAAANAAK